MVVRTKNKSRNKILPSFNCDINFVFNSISHIFHNYTLQAGKLYKAVFLTIILWNLFTIATFVKKIAKVRLSVHNYNYEHFICADSYHLYLNK